MSDVEKKQEKTVEEKGSGRGLGKFAKTCLAIVGIVVAIPVALAIPVGVFLGYCWVIAWMVAHFFL